ncbi:MAG: glycosyltransferase family A protein [Verrucomicrobiia bacterium]
MTRPLVSILIPARNAMPWVLPCIESVLAQTWAEREIRVHDDGSTDGTRECLEAFGEEFILTTSSTLGSNVVRNRLLGEARGEWIQFVDADDVLLPGKIEAQMEVALKEDKVDVVYSPFFLLEERVDAVLEPSWYPEPPHDLWELHVRWQLGQTGTVLLRASTLREVGGWNEQQVVCQDNELFFRLLRAGARFAWCEHRGAAYRVRSTSLSRNKVSLTHQTMLELLAATAEHLRAQGEWTPGRARAAARTRFEIARAMWDDDPEAARRVVRKLLAEMPDFVPVEDASRMYCWAWRTGGFPVAQAVRRMGHRWFQR